MESPEIYERNNSGQMIVDQKQAFQQIVLEQLDIYM